MSRLLDRRALDAVAVRDRWSQARYDRWYAVEAALKELKINELEVGPHAVTAVDGESGARWVEPIVQGPDEHPVSSALDRLLWAVQAARTNAP